MDIPLTDENLLVWLGLHALANTLANSMRPKLEIKYGPGGVPNRFLTDDGTHLEFSKVIGHVVSKRTPYVATARERARLSELAVQIRDARNAVCHSETLSRRDAAEAIECMRELCVAASDLRAASDLAQLAQAARDPTRRVKIEGRGTVQQVTIESSLIRNSARRPEAVPDSESIADELVASFLGGETEDTYLFTYEISEDERAALDRERGSDLVDEDFVRNHVSRVEGRIVRHHS